MHHTRYAPAGMVCSVDHLASSAGVAMLRSGGTAADAAVAASAVLAVTCQHMCGMGGDLFALVHDRAGPPAVLNASGRAGSGADAERMRAEGHRAMPLRGDIRSTPVPGCVDGWVALHGAYGRLPLGDVLAPAVGYARHGFPASPLLAWSLFRIAGVANADDYPTGDVRPGTVIRRPRVADALEAIAVGGRDAFYLGPFGDGLLEVGGGEYTQADLEAPNADWVEPLAVDAWGHRIWTVPPNSQGYLTLAGAWIADQLDLPDDPRDPLWAHLLVEASRQAGCDRTDVLWEGADGKALVAPERLRARRDAIDPHNAASLGDPPPAPGGTIFLCAVDSDRMGVSLIQSNASGWGAHIVEPNTRIFLQDRGIGFSLVPGHPAEYGPRRRPPHTLSPALVTTAEGVLEAVIGTMGGDSQPQVLLQLLARILRHREEPGDAVAAPRWVLGAVGESSGFDTWAAGGAVRVELEADGAAVWEEGLRTRGHATAPATNTGHAHVIVNRGDHLAGAADPRAFAEAAVGF